MYHRRPRTTPAARRLRRGITTAVVGCVAAGCIAATQGSANATPDDFFQYNAGSSLGAHKAGDVLATRTLPYHLVGVATPITAVQIRYRSTDALGRPSSNITSVLEPPGGQRSNDAVAYQSFYDSLNPEDSPSRSIAGGGVSTGGAINAVESAFIGQLLARGFPVIIADTEGQRADFAAGPEYGYNTLDSIRAASHVNATGLNPNTRIGLLGYSGGAIGTNWAAALAPSYAPDVNRRMVGAVEGGVLVDPARNLVYIGGSSGWAGVAAMAITGVGRSYGIDFSPYLNDYGKQVVARMQNASISEVLYRYPGLTWAQLTKPQYADPQSVRPYVAATRKINLGAAPTPTIPMYIGQGANGDLEGTAGSNPTVGHGDGVMVAGDVRSLARQYCATGNHSIEYTQFDQLSHTMAMLPTTEAGMDWLEQRFAGQPAPSDCGAIVPGNSLAQQ